MLSFTRTGSVSKRTFDLLGAGFLLVGFSPLLAGIAAWIWWDDGCPVLFRQRRVGKNGERFHIHKFRTLIRKPDDPTQPSKHTTRIGPMLRRWGLDELPQLWNVVRGEMSLVGPRPTLPQQVEQYGPYEHTRLEVLPGITGWAQIHGRNALPWSERIDLDVWYVQNRSLLLDLRILIRTPIVLIRGTGVEGPDGRNPTYSSSSSQSHA